MNTIKICVAGVAGRMGKAIAQSVLQSQHLELTAATLSEEGNAYSVGDLIGAPGLDLLPVTLENLNPDVFDVLIDFTTPEATFKHLAFCQKAQKAIVIGTTGFSEVERSEIFAVAEQIPTVLAANTSRGIQLLTEIIESLTQRIGVEADIEIIESHHRHKKDAPSGTALKLGETVASALGKNLKDVACYTRHGVSDKGRDHKIGFSVIRAGDIVGEHTVMFALPGERLEIKHTATSRQTFAEGAVTAAHWLHGQPPGLYSMKDVLGH